MNTKEIQQAITKLSPEELVLFRAWFNEYVGNIEAGELNDSQEEFEDRLKKFRGSFKGKGLLKALMEERRKDSFL